MAFNTLGDDETNEHGTALFNQAGQYKGPPCTDVNEGIIPWTNAL